METDRYIPCIHSNDHRYFCKECLSFLCDKCKLFHLHRDIIDETFFYSFAKFELEMTKSKLEKFQSFRTFNEIIGFKRVKNELISFYNDLLNLENELMSILGDQDTDINVILFNLRSILDEEAKLNTGKMDNNSLLNIMRRFSKYNQPFKKLNNVNEKFEDSFNNFYPLLNDLNKYKKTKDGNNEKIIIMNNSDIVEKIVKEKLEEIGKSNKEEELQDKIKLLLEENEKLIEMNQKLLETIQNSKSNNDYLNQETSETLPNTRNIKIDQDLYNIYSNDKANLFQFFQKNLIETVVDIKDVNEIDKIEIKKFTKMTYENVVTQLNIYSKINIFELNFEEFSNFLVDKKIFDNIKDSQLFSEYIDKFKSILLTEIVRLLYSHKDIIYSDFKNNFFANYFTYSQRIKNLKSLDLKSSAICDSDIRRITDIINFSKVFDVYLQNNSVSDAGVLDLFSNLTSNRLKNLYVNNNLLTEKSLIHFRNALKDKVSLFENMKIVSFENNRINEAKGKEIIKDVKKNVKFTIYFIN